MCFINHSIPFLERRSQDQYFKTLGPIDNHPKSTFDLPDLLLSFQMFTGFLFKSVGIDHPMSLQWPPIIEGTFLFTIVEGFMIFSYNIISIPSKSITPRSPLAKYTAHSNKRSSNQLTLQSLKEPSPC